MITKHLLRMFFFSLGTIAVFIIGMFLASI